MVTVLQEMDSLIEKLQQGLMELRENHVLSKEERKTRTFNLKINAEKLSYYNDLISIDPDILEETKERRKIIISSLIGVIDLMYQIEDSL